MDEATRKSLEIQAVDLVWAIHRSIDWQTVDPRTYWERLAQTVRVSATTRTTVSAMIETALIMMQIHQPTKGSAATIHSVLTTVGSWPDEAQQEFLRLFREEPVILVTRARIRIDREKNIKRQKA